MAAPKLAPPPFSSAIGNVNSPGSIGDVDNGFTGNAHGIGANPSGVGSGVSGGGGTAVGGASGSGVSPELMQYINEIFKYAVDGFQLTLGGDVTGGPTTIGQGVDTTITTAINLPNVTEIDGGASGTNYANETEGPYGTDYRLVTLEDDVQVEADTQELNFTGAGVNVTTDGSRVDVTIAGGGGGGGGGQWVLIETNSISSGATLDLTWDESTYIAIRVEVRNMLPVSDNVQLQARFGHTNGTTIYSGAKYAYNAQIITAGASNSTGQTQWQIDAAIGNQSDEGCSFVFELNNIGTAQHLPTFKSQVSGMNPSRQVSFQQTFGYYDLFSADTVYSIDALQFFFSTGNIQANGTYYLYGLKNS